MGAALGKQDQHALYTDALGYVPSGNTWATAIKVRVPLNFLGLGVMGWVIGCVG